jgi:4-methyl-5(b-hydroxyethyl)-thiazole monophosphate biosynthesis
VRGAHDVVVSVDAGLEDADASALDLVALPGGMPGAANLAGNQGVLELVRRVYDAGGLAAAICAAPWVLDRAGVLKGRRATCYPTFEDRLTTCAVCTGARVEVDGRIITGRGPGPAIEFALALVTALGAPGKAAELRRGMLLD